MGFFSKIARLFGRKKHHTYYTFDRDLPEEEIEENRDEILALLKSVNRNGMDKVISYMRKNNFFTVPSSVHKHHNYKGGLAQHVLSVYHKAKEKSPDLPDDSLIIVSILHDLCKADLLYYDKKGGLHRNHGKSQRRGFKSIKILRECGFDLTESERLAIRWHMGGSNARADEVEDANRARTDELAKTLLRANREDAYEHEY